MSRETGYWQRFSRRQITRRRLLAATGTTALAAVAAATVGCGDDDDSTAGPGAASPTAGQAVKPKRGGTLVLAGTFSGDPPTLDPYGHLSFLSQYIGVHSYGRLLKWKTGPNVVPLSEAVPDLAQSYELGDGGATVTFKLRQGVKFHNKPPLNGRVLTAEDVMVSFDRYRAKSPNGRSLDVVDKLESPDAGTLVFKLKRPFSPFVELIASPNALWIMPREVSAGQIDPTKVEGVIGTGPWVFDSYRPSAELKFLRNPQYYGQLDGEQTPFLDGIQYLIMPEYAQQMSQFVAGRTSAFTPKNADVASVRSQANGAKENITRPGWLWTAHRFNKVGNNGLFNNPLVRQAASMAIDRDGLIDAFGEISKLKGQGVTLETGWNNTLSPWGDGGMFWWLDPKSKEFGPSAKYYNVNTAEAKKMLQAANYDNSPIDFNFVTGTYGTVYDQFAEAQIPMLKQAGFNINPKVWEYKRMIGSEESKSFPGIFYNYQTPFSTIDEYAYVDYHTDVEPRSYPQLTYTTPEIVSLIDKQRTEFDTKKRQQMIFDIARKSSEIMACAPSVMSRWSTVTMAQRSVRNLFEYATAGYGAAAETYPHVWLDSSS